MIKSGITLPVERVTVGAYVSVCARAYVRARVDLCVYARTCVPFVI